MTRPAPPLLTARSEHSQGSFTAGRDVVVGNDLRADLRVAHPLIARAHLLLRFDRGRWLAVDNNTLNGVYLDGRRVPVVDIRDGQSINIGKPDGPRITFEVGRPPARSFRRRDAGRTAAQPQAGAGEFPTTRVAVAGPEADRRPVTGRAAWIGRALDNDIVIHDVLASRRHAFVTPTPAGPEIRDANSSNGTFVNGVRVTSAALSEGDVVTIGNVDLMLRGGALVRMQEAATRAGGLEVREVNFAIGDKRLLERISLTARPGTLTALIGGSGAGKTTLSRLIAGYATPTSGSVTFEGHDIHTEYASLRTRIGMVPQDDVVHRQLTVSQALGYAAELRLPPDTSKADRARVVAEVLDELGLTEHANTRVDRLSGGQRKRASVALELLTGPSLLILDEPTSGLDPALDLQVMTMLRQLADAGRVVLVVTHSLTYLDVCDQVLLMAPGGKTAFLGPPGQIGPAMGTTNWAHIFAKVGADPDEANRRFLAQNRPPPPRRTQALAELGAPPRTSKRHQFSTIARRQVRLVVSDRAYFVFLAVLPFVMGALSLTVPGSAGFGYADPAGESAGEAGMILTLLTMAAAFMGTALTIRDLIGERPIFRREQAVGLSTTAYLLAKVAVFCGFAVVQAAIATAIVVLGKGPPTRPAVLLGPSSSAATVELFVAVAATCVAAAMLGLLLSALARTGEQVMPMLVVSLMMQMVLCGGMVPVTDRILLDQASWLMPSRWGYAAQGSTVDLWAVSPGPQSPRDSHFQHAPVAWLLDMGMLAVLSVGYGALVRWRIRLAR
ncbi:ATP-binding cassette domain-containing protein [Mycobacterium intracellulare]|uniref:ABC transporter ATP-binding protein n=1 Tax=Mycobacterium intracellulare subsp. chimaera TaxID=222805 RepID=A0A220YHN5_MYCIT|nr:ATP-binding cassette domain-containing protein [Mycobacterium intracellulare]APD84347.1 ABC transporter ATP-binding protein [Mycobacterium intracellulare subsp. chimaera]ARV83968.1 ABC transporter ATP-binding protein [Mycobacterium intracellulare subsp. chimaera]ASL11258.1 ABC transporter ATP-binding protein [Mycobacterium intracellulare subsp. chimaera]ASL17135.1 ABC transporter ATP-binding protein [Mycobacterium intracellulare subsp. chimaera]ASL23181.1 ABC transporter ATP-binding protein